MEHSNKSIISASKNPFIATTTLSRITTATIATSTTTTIVIIPLPQIPTPPTSTPFPSFLPYLLFNYLPLPKISNNFSPLFYGYGKYLWMMQGMFRANGCCGYVKKTDFLLKNGPNNKVFDPIIREQVKKTLKVKIYMGDGWHLEFHHTHFNQFSPPDFFTKLQLWGVPADKKKVKTVPIEDQWVPQWNEGFEFPLTAPELAILRIEVRDYNMSRRHDFGGQTCLPVSELSGVVSEQFLCITKRVRSTSMLNFLCGFSFYESYL